MKVLLAVAAVLFVIVNDAESKGLCSTHTHDRHQHQPCPNNTCCVELVRHFGVCLDKSAEGKKCGPCNCTLGLECMTNARGIRTCQMPSTTPSVGTSPPQTNGSTTPAAEETTSPENTDETTSPENTDETSEAPATG